MTEQDPSSMTGIEQLRIAFGAGGPRGIGKLVNMTVDELAVGRVVFSITPDETMTNPLGTVHGGIAATLLDSVASCAVHSVLGVGASYTTSQLNIHYTRAVQVTTPRITGVGEVVHHGRRVATATATITDDDGRIVAHGTVTCAVRTPD